jgi:transposase-like protein
MRQAVLAQDVLALEESEAVVITTDNQLQESLDCPDCSDTMIKFYDWDKMKYLCENCGLTIANPATVLYVVQE